MCRRAGPPRLRRHRRRLKQRANKDRAAAQDRQRQGDERRHAEAMEKIGQSHASFMAALEQQRQGDERRHAETMAALAEQSRALETVIERTAPRESE